MGEKVPGVNATKKSWDRSRSNIFILDNDYDYN